MRTSLCLLTFNEIAGCRHDVPRIKQIANNFKQVYAIDGGSQDGTLEYLRKEGIKTFVQQKRGLNAAFHYGLEKCEADAIIFFHPKGTVPVKDILKFKPLFKEGYEFIIGSRMIKGSHNEEDNKYLKPRKWASILLSFLVAALYRKQGPILWDVLHGFRGITKEAFKKMEVKDHGKVTIDIEMVIRSYKKKIKSIEFPTKESTRLSGETHFKILPTGIKILKYLVRELARTD